MYNGIIYKITCLENNSFLFGSTKNLRNYKVSDEVKLKISLTTKGRKKSEEWKSKLCIPILQFSLNNEFIKEWKSAKEIGLNFNVDSTSFIQCCKHKQKTAYGFIWKYKDKTLQKTKYRIK